MAKDLVLQNMREDLVEKKMVEDLVEKKKMVEDLVEKNMVEDLVEKKMVEDLVKKKMVEDLVGKKMAESLVGQNMAEDRVEKKMVEDLVGKKMVKDLVEKKMVEDLMEKKMVEDLVEKQMVEDLVEKKMVEDLVEKKMVEDLVEKKMVEDLMEKKMVEDLVEQNVAEDLVEQNMVEDLVEQNMGEDLLKQDNDIPIFCIEEELSQLTALQLSSSSESDSLSEGEDSQRQLQQFVDLSEKFLDELTILEAKYEAEQTCEERAEEHSTQVQGENKNLNSIDTEVSTTMLSKQPEYVQPMVRGDQSKTEVGTDASREDQRLIEETKKNVQNLSEEKEQISSELKELKMLTKKLNKELKEERLEKEAICAKLGKSQNKFLKLNRLSLAVTREYADALDQLELEQSLRHEAESYASKVLKEKKAISRQSMILMQNVQPNEMLVKALDDVRSMTTTLEDTKRELQTKVVSLEKELSERPTKEELLAIQEDLKVTNAAKSQLEEEVKVTKEKCTRLEERVKSLEKELERKGISPNSVDNESEVASPISPPPPPPPPPPPTCPLFKTPEDPLALIKQRRGQQGTEGSAVTAGGSTRDDAVREMMERIKSGVILRPARNDRKNKAEATKRKSVICELQGMLMNTIRKPMQKQSRRRMSRKAKDSELESALQRRRRIVDTPQKAGSIKNRIAHPESSEKSIITEDPQPPLKTLLDNKETLSSEKQIQKTLVQQNSQKRHTEARLVTWQ